MTGDIVLQLLLFSISGTFCALRLKNRLFRPLLACDLFLFLLYTCKYLFALFYSEGLPLTLGGK